MEAYDPNATDSNVRAQGGQVALGGGMGIPKTVWLIGGVVIFIVLFWVGYTIIADYGDEVVSGTYTLDLNGERSTLVLKGDHTFQQELSRSGHVEHAQGEWGLFGEGHIAFSQQFLTIHGEELSSGGTAYGVVKKSFGILPSICLDPNPGGPTYHKKPFV